MAQITIHKSKIANSSSVRVKLKFTRLPSFQSSPRRTRQFVYVTPERSDYKSEQKETFMGCTITRTSSLASFSPLQTACLLCVLGLGLLLAGCGGSNGSSVPSTGFSASASTQFASQVAGAAATGMITSIGSTGSFAELERANSVTCTPTSCVVNIPVSFTAVCPTGGTLQVTGTINGTTNGSGTGTIDVQAAININNWMCVSGFVINGDPNIMVSGTFNFVNGVAAGNQSVAITGGFSFGSSPSDVCTVNLTINFNLTGAGSITGTLCGNQINATFPTAQSNVMKAR
jgi:hypothetical protein